MTFENDPSKLQKPEELRREFEEAEGGWKARLKEAQDLLEAGTALLIKKSPAISHQERMQAFSKLEKLQKEVVDLSRQRLRSLKDLLERADPKKAED